MSNSSDSHKSQQYDSLVSYEDLILKENSLERISVKKVLKNILKRFSFSKAEEMRNLNEFFCILGFGQLICVHLISFIWK